MLELLEELRLPVGEYASLRKFVPSDCSDHSDRLIPDGYLLNPFTEAAARAAMRGQRERNWPPRPVPSCGEGRRGCP
ncbi:hypothetical protein [Ramlibacter sp.]|uniref:hypothetical protein n=1 Tax=Ramlibacter sp. TaxID=1917967 RepID=UPI0026322908|nr:hypothetical protein [Ramlibacter sp.]